MKKTLSFGLMVIAVALVSSCTKNPLNNLSEEESRIYITNYDSTVDFGSYKTYSMVDSVAIIDQDRLSGYELDTWDAGIIAAFKNAMNERGFMLVDRNDDPDIGINVSRLYNTYSGIVRYPDYWGGYGGYYDPYYWGYGGYPYYFPPTYGIYEVTEGAVSIDMLDLKNSEQASQIAGIWNGLIRGTGIFDTGNVQKQIAALFDQSPYLRTNQ